MKIKLNLHMHPLFSAFINDKLAFETEIPLEDAVLEFTLDPEKAAQLAFIARLVQAAAETVASAVEAAAIEEPAKKKARKKSSPRWVDMTPVEPEKKVVEVVAEKGGPARVIRRPGMPVAIATGLTADELKVEVERRTAAGEVFEVELVEERFSITPLDEA